MFAAAIWKFGVMKKKLPVRRAVQNGNALTRRLHA
jgi:hypothetical protein